jgi:hypothetical protein
MDQATAHLIDAVTNQRWIKVGPITYTAGGESHEVPGGSFEGIPTWDDVSRIGQALIDAADLSEAATDQGDRSYPNPPPEERAEREAKIRAAFTDPSSVASSLPVFTLADLRRWAYDNEYDPADFAPTDDESPAQPEG